MEVILEIQSLVKEIQGDQFFAYQKFEEREDLYTCFLLLQVLFYEKIEFFKYSGEEERNLFNNRKEISFEQFSQLKVQIHREHSLMTAV